MLMMRPGITHSHTLWLYQGVMTPLRCNPCGSWNTPYRGNLVIIRQELSTVYTALLARDWLTPWRRSTAEYPLFVCIYLVHGDISTLEKFFIVHTGNRTWYHTSHERMLIPLSPSYNMYLSNFRVNLRIFRRRRVMARMEKFKTTCNFELESFISNHKPSDGMASVTTLSQSDVSHCMLYTHTYETRPQLSKQATSVSLILYLDKPQHFVMTDWWLNFTNK